MIAHQECVAGVYPPAFVERKWHGDAPTSAAKVSPEFTLRPSLSGVVLSRFRRFPLACRRSLPSGLR